MGDTSGAMRVLERAVADAPADARLADTLDRWRREAELHDRMQPSTNASFRSKDRRRRRSRSNPESLDRACGASGEALSTFPTRSIIYTHRRAVSRHHAAPRWRAHDGTIRVPVRGRLRGRRADRAHEFRPRSSAAGAAQHAGMAERELARRRSGLLERGANARRGATPCPSHPAHLRSLLQRRPHRSRMPRALWSPTADEGDAPLPTPPRHPALAYPDDASRRIASIVHAPPMRPTARRVPRKGALMSSLARRVLTAHRPAPAPEPTTDGVSRPKCARRYRSTSEQDAHRARRRHLRILAVELK